MSDIVLARPHVEQICEDLNYTRMHVVSILRDNAKRLGAHKVKAEWHIPRGSIRSLRKMVRETSGRRYKLGEKGPQR